MAGDRIRPGTTLRLALAGTRTDRARVLLTGVSSAMATLVLLTTAAVLLLGQSWAGGFGLQVLGDPGLRAGVVTALLLLLLPVVILVGLSSRVGAPGRDRRLSALRLAGATPAEVRRIVTIETMVACVPGGVLGLGLAAFVPDLAAQVPTPPHQTDLSAGVYIAYNGAANPFEPPSLWSQLTAHPWVTLAVLAVVPLVSALAARWALRAVSVTPLGVVRRARKAPPAVAPVLLLVVGIALVATSPRWLPEDSYSSALPDLVFLGSGILMLLGVVFFAAPASSLLGRLIAPRTRSGAGLLAARRMIRQPYGASRTLSCVGLVALVGGGVAVARPMTLADVAQNDGGSGSDNFYVQSFDAVTGVMWVGLVITMLGLLVILVESQLTRRRELAVLVAQGVQRGVLARATVLESVLPVIPLVVLSAAAGALAAAGLYTSQPYPYPLRLDWSLLVGVIAGSVAAVLVVTLLSLLSLRTVTDPEELRAT